MAIQDEHDHSLNTIPVGPLGLIPMKGCEPFCEKVDAYLSMWRQERYHGPENNLAFLEYQKDSYIVDAAVPRFGSGEAKGIINQSVRGSDLFIFVDVCNYSLTYSLNGHENHMSPDDHFQDLKRIIAAVGGKAQRITVIMPFLYESRQHRRTGRESLDCAMMLQELVSMGVTNILTFDAHDPRVQNAIPLSGFEDIPCTYQFLKALLYAEPDLEIDSSQLMVISPDEGGMNRAVKYANYLGLDVGMFYKRRDYTRMEDGRNPIIAHEFLGSDVSGKDVLIVDDMLSSGDSILEVAKELKNRHARKVFVAATFGLFTNGLEQFDEYYDKGIIDLVLTTNLIYQPPELLERPYYQTVDLSKYLALIIDHLNHNASIHDLLIPTDRINRLLARYQEKRKKKAAKEN